MDEQTHTADELEIDINADEAADTAADDTKDQDTESEDEQKRDTLDVGEKPTDKSRAETARDKQAEAWATKIANGVKTIDDLPPDLKWLKPHVEAKLGTSKKPVDELDLDSKVEEVVTKKENERKLRNLVAELNETLPRAKKVELKEKRDRFLAKGLSPLDSLEAAMEALNIDLEEDRMNARRQAARLRAPGRFKAPGKGITPEAVHTEGGYAEVRKNFTEEQRLEYLRRLKGSSVR